jgi:predicted ATPase/DNA-binding NarL/FixJ family response regulator
MVGREKEIGDLIGLLKEPEIRLITLHGLGGTGKTRLAVETGQAALDLFPDGVWFVPLAPLNSPEHINSATAAGLGFSFQSHEDQQGQLIRFLQGREALLIFDNLEHLLPEASGYLENILENASNCRLLITSRQPLSAPWEMAYPVQGLDYETRRSSADDDPPAAVQLFLQNLARVAGPAAGNDGTCAAEICQIVKGHPLALLLAASWGRTLDCEAITQEIQQGIGFLQTQQKTFPERQSSMQAVFDYSWGLLSDHEQAALRKLSVFQGGFDRHAAAEVAGSQLSLLARLIDQSLVERVSKDRYQIHELLRQYLNDRLEEAGEKELVRDRHLSYYTHLAEQAEPELMGKRQQLWLGRLKTEIDNIRAALDWSLIHGEAADLERGLRLMASSERFWHNHAYTEEARKSVVRFLDSGPAGVNSHSYEIDRGRGYNLASSLSWALEDLPQARDLANEALQIGTSVNDPRTIGDAYYNLGRAAFLRRDSRLARSSLNQALESYEKCGSLPGTTDALIALGRDEYLHGDVSDAFGHLRTALEFAKEREDIRTKCLALRSLGELALADSQIGPRRAITYLEEALPYAREVDDKRSFVHISVSMGEAARLLGEFERAVAMFEEADSLASEVGLTEGRITIQLNLGFVHLRLGDYGKCKHLFLDNLKLSQSAEHLKVELALCLLGLAGVSAAEGQAQWAAKFLGTIDGYKEEIFYSPSDRNDHERIVTSVKAQLIEKQFDQLYKEGQALGLVDAAQLVQNQGLGEKGRDVERIGKLTKREIEVLRLVAQGLSDAQVAERLVLSPRTVNAHLTSIYNKLGVNSRAAATRFAVEHALA